LANALDALLARIVDKDLREAISVEVSRLKESRDFGLVFERHLPESLRLANYPITRGCQVQERASLSGPTWIVSEVSDEIASLVDVKTGELNKTPLSELVAIKGFGEAIYPGFKRLDAIFRGGEKAPNLLINGENYYVLESLLYAFEEHVDVIYIDPPYNTGARDWKYNNNYVDDSDAYRHSKWLAFMERRLVLAKRLLKSDDSVLIVTIDEKEYLRLGMLLTQMFPEARIQMVSSVINPKGTGRSADFSRTDEYIFYVFIGNAKVADSKAGESSQEVRWKYLRRTDIESRRGTRKGGPSQFYPIYVNPDNKKIVEIGQPLPANAPRDSAPKRDGLVAVFPIREADGMEMNWGLTGGSLKKALDAGFVRVSEGKSELQPFVFAYLTAPNISRIEKGELIVAGSRPDGSLVVLEPAGKRTRPTTQWRESSHEAGAYGTTLLRALVPNRKFPFPKSLYAVEDSLRHVLADKPNALVVDFFAGSGTTGHALMRLNKQDGGNRRFILATNNEVSDDEASELSSRGFAPGDPEWEAQGIFQYITQPRLKAAVTGVDHDGNPVVGDYKFTDEFPISDGFKENLEFFDLQFLDVNNVARGKAFESIAPILWMKAGAGHVMLTEEAPDYLLSKGCNYAILFNLNAWQSFVIAVRDSVEVKHVFVVTDSRASYQQVVQELGTDCTSTMLYEDYLRNFEISIGSRA
jgi:adenine-specific DNA-methyltransferase